MVAYGYKYTKVNSIHKKQSIYYTSMDNQYTR